MAKSTAVWGIDIGRCALKALRCHVDGDAIVADGFDYIEYPKLLTQPEADAPQLIKEALEQFLSRNSVKGDKVAISVSGESGLARYFKPPPVDVKKIADIVKYEARQQIPFALEDVIWDYERMAGGQEVDGFALDTEIGLFAMKREQVTKAMLPYDKAGIEIDVIQLAPIAIYNYIAHDVSKELPEGESYSSDNPPPSLVVLSIGTDTTDLVVTNGYRVWQRNIPLGGNHFTRQLSKELKLTFAKAEHLKRNPKQAEDPKAIFQAMRPVFADMVTEVQRSIGFFQSLDRKAKINGIVVLGNTVKLPGLVQYLAKHLGHEVKEIESFNKLGGASVVASPSFKDNVLGFATCYGLCLQGLGKGKLSTNLLPREILTHRMIRAKKPWAIAGVSALVLACALNYIFYYNSWKKVHPEVEYAGGKTWAQAVESAKSVSAKSSTLVADDTAKVATLDKLKQIGQEVVGSADRRLLWLEVMKAINQSLPPMAPGMAPNQPPPDPTKLPFTKRRDLKIQYVETQFFPDLSVWFNDRVKTKYLELNPQIASAPADGSAAPAAAPAPAPAPVAAMPSGDMGSDSASYGGDMYGGGYGTTASAAPQIDVSGISVAGPTGPGWVIEITGHHYYNDPSDRRNAGPAHVRNTLLHWLENGVVEVPLGPGQGVERFTMDELGIGFAILAYNPPLRSEQIKNENFTPPANQTTGDATGFGVAGPMGSAPASGVPGQVGGQAAIDPDNPPFFTVQRYDFKVQFVWQEKPLNVRLEERLQKEKAAKEAAEAAAASGQPAEAAATPAVVAPPAAPPPLQQPLQVDAPIQSGTPAAPTGGAAPENGAAPPENGAVPPASGAPGPSAPPPAAPVNPAAPPANPEGAVPPTGPGNGPPAAEPATAPPPAAPASPPALPAIPDMS